MKIESIIKRQQGTTVVLGNKTYAWNAGNSHVCEVENEDHAERLLAVKEGFRAVEEGSDPAPEATKPAGGRKKKATTEEGSDPAPEA